MKIDCYTHVTTPRYRKALSKYHDKILSEKRLREWRPAMIDPENRLQVLEPFEDIVQVLSASIPPLPEVVGPREAVELARIANDELAEWVARYPKKYIAAIANLPMDPIDGALKEAERAINELGFKGVQIFTSVQGKPVSLEEFMPLYEMMARFDLPIWMHPVRTIDVPDYPTEKESVQRIFAIFGWPYETSVAMTRLVFAGVFEKFPALKIITHHCGGMIPFFADRIGLHFGNQLQQLGKTSFPGLPKQPLEYFKMFYCDTALNGNTSALMCGYEFFGEDHLLFGSDMPYDTENGALDIRETVEAIDRMHIPEASRNKIYEGNARRLMHLY